MTERERQLKKRIQLVVASAMAVFFCLLLTLTVTLSVRANQRNTIERLEATEAKLTEQLQNETAMIDYYLTQKFIEEIAMQKWNMAKTS